MLTLPIGPVAGLAQVKKLTVRKSGIQARYLYISALRHAGKLAYPAKPPNGESLDRLIRAHKKQGNHPAGVIVDMQFPCHGTPQAHAPRAGSMRGTRLLVPMRGTGSTVGATCQCRSGILCYAGKRGQSKRPHLLRRVLHSAKFWRSGGAATSFQVATGGASAPR